VHNRTYVRTLEEQSIDNWLAALKEMESIPQSIHEVTNSFSWKITRPIRIVRALYLKIRNRLSKLFVE
jgi:hypothetical protein